MLQAFSDLYVSALLLCFFAVVLGWPVILFLLWRSIMREVRHFSASLETIAEWNRIKIARYNLDERIKERTPPRAQMLSQFGR